MANRAMSLGLVLVAAFATLAATFTIVPAASATQNVVVGENPIYNEPRVMDGRVYAIDSHGDDVIVGGTFTTIRNAPASGPELPQAYLFKFNVATGQIDTAFNPQVDGEVEGVAISDDGAWVYVGGDFATINGVARQRIAKLSTVDGSVDTTFIADANNTVKDIALMSDALVVGGRFQTLNGVLRQRLGAVDLTTGAALASFNLPITDSRYEFAPHVQEIDVSEDEHWLVIGGNFKQVGGVEREQIAVIDLSGTSASVANWGTDRYVPDCSISYQSTYIRGLDISPDSTYFVVNTTGAHLGTDVMCDTAARWELPPTLTGTGLQPTWRNFTGGDTHWAAHITEAAVYIGGHMRWENNPHPDPGHDYDGPGSVERYGVAALDPTSGVPLSWNPGRDRGRGAEVIYSTDDYLFVGSDTNRFGPDPVTGLPLPYGTPPNRQRLAVLRAAGGIANPLPEQIELPANVHVALPGGILVRAAFNGAAFGSAATVSGPDIDGIHWSNVRDGFVQHGQLSYFGAADAFYRRSINGASFGAPTNLSTSVGYVDTAEIDEDTGEVNEGLHDTPYDQPLGVASTYAAGYADGRIYYTATDDVRLFWRWYALESGIIGAEEHIASGQDWTGAVALDVIGDWLYAAWEDGNLYRMYLRGGGVVDLSTTQLVDDGSSGIDWSAAKAMFSTQRSGSVPQIPPPGEVSCDTALLPWRAEYFPTKTLGSSPVAVRCEADIDNNWGAGSPPDTGVGPNNFSVRWTRDVVVAEPSSLVFNAVSSDGIRIKVDDRWVMNEWRIQDATAFNDESDVLAAGSHEVVVEYYESLGNAVARLDVTVMPDGGEPPPPPPPSPGATFIDVPDTHTFYGDIEWMAAEGITRGCNPPANDRYCPDSSVTRGQMAAFLNRAFDLPSTPVDFFVDDNDSVFEGDINRLAAAGISRGCNPPANDRFCPDTQLNREQMAAFLARALGLTDDGRGDLFIDDDDSIFERDIDRLGTAGITKGCNPPTNNRYCPDNVVTRAQMAAFLRRAIG